MNSKKTYKREAAAFLGAILAYLVFTNNMEMMSIVVWPFVSFGAGAFGMDALKQLR